jgi:hypothetical protein
MNLFEEFKAQLDPVRADPAFRSAAGNDPGVLKILWEFDSKYAEAKRRNFARVNEIEAILEPLGQQLKTFYKTASPGDIPLSVRTFARWGQKILRDAGAPVACRLPEPRGTVSFDNVKGLNTAKEELKLSYVLPTVQRGLFPLRKGGTLLYGPPGTGKTLLAKAAANELERTVFYNVTAGDLKGRYYGDTEKNIHRVFECASEYLGEHADDVDNALIFIDEIDGVALSRSARDADPTVAISVLALLQAIDGIKSDIRVSVMGATNHPEKLDSAIIGRFPSRIYVDLPDFAARESIVLSKLQETYRAPGTPPTDTDSAWLMFKHFGHYYESETPEQAEVRLASGQPRPVSFVTPDVARIIAQLTGPRPPVRPTAEADAKAIRQYELLLRSKLNPTMRSQTLNLEANADLAAEFHASALRPYGFSARDLDRAMNRAIDLASSRAAQDWSLFSEASFPDTIEEDTLGEGPEQSLWIYDNVVSVKTQREPRPPDYHRLNGELMTGRTDPTLVVGRTKTGLPIINTMRIRNYCIQGDDILLALQQTGSTVNAEEYFGLLEYAYGEKSFD